MKRRYFFLRLTIYWKTEFDIKVKNFSWKLFFGKCVEYYDYDEFVIVTMNF